MRDKWTVEWSGAYPNLCTGTWTLFKNGEKVDTVIPFQHEPADTFGNYSHWYFDQDYFEQNEWYEDGLSESEWCEEYADWLKTIAPEDEWGFIYDAFSLSDWRYGSCMGCV